jgi:hypothetical protein
MVMKDSPQQSRPLLEKREKWRTPGEFEEILEVIS